MKIFIAVLCTLLFSATGFAQNSSNADLKSRIGLFGNIDYSLHSASFNNLPTVPNCCPEFSSATHMGWLFGLSYISPIDETWTMHIRMHYWSFGAEFSQTENVASVDLAGGPSQATIQHDLNAAFQQISIEPLVGFHLSRDFSLLGGITAGYMFSATYDQKETLVTPEDGLFANQSRQRNAVEGDIPNANSYGIGITLGASYDIALNEDRSVFLSPEVLVTIAPMGLVQDVTWSAQHIRAGLALSFAPPEIEDTLTELELYEFAKALTPPTKGTPGVAFTSSLNVSGVSLDGKTAPVSTVRIEEFASTRIRPLLPYVFFDQGSSTIPPRYRALGEGQTSSFSMGNFYNLDAMVTYYHLLNIVGKRLSDDPSATINVTGYTDPTEESAGTTLAQKRAEAVRNYLRDTWRIDGSRINVDSKGLPSQPSNQTTADGQAENRRVELSSNEASILMPVESKDTMRVPEPAGLRFQPAIDPTVPIATWTVFVSADDALIKTFHNGDPVPPSVEWNISEKMQYIPKGTTQLKAMLAVRDSAGAVIPSETQVINVSEITLSDKARSGGVDKNIDRYSLILFGVDQSDLSKEHQAAIDEIKTRIQSNSQVSVVGYTDRSGADDHNLRLSEQRAKTVAKALGLNESAARGVGERLPLYDNSNPEGRFYSRTVEVLVETPRR